MHDASEKKLKLIMSLLFLELWMQSHSFAPSIAIV
jgi:hypothetical protein